MNIALPWPEIPWDPGLAPLDWLFDRVDLMVGRARGFELALEQACVAGEAALSTVADELAEWERCAANVFMYAGLRQAEQLGAEDVAAHAEELEKVWNELSGLRQVLLERLGEEAAERVVDREGLAKVDAAQVSERVGEQPAFVAATDRLSGVQTLMPSLTGPRTKPVTADELRMRQAAEQKALPEPATLALLLEQAPSDWVGAIFDILGLELPEEIIAAPRAARRKEIRRHHANRESLESLVAGLPDEARALLGEILERGGVLRHSEVVERYGMDEADGFHWTARPPSGPLAWLRRMGLAFVGNQDGLKVALVPEDLRERLEAELAKDG